MHLVDGNWAVSGGAGGLPPLKPRIASKGRPTVSRMSTCLLGSCLNSSFARRAVYLNCACLKVLTCPFLSPPVRSCPEGGTGTSHSDGVYFGGLQAHAMTGVVGRGYA